MATLTSLEHILSSSENKCTNKNLRDVSFSYLSSTDEIFVRKLAQSSRNISTCDDDQEYHVTDNHNLSRRKIKQEDGEIGVFSAEKYFNGVIQQVDHSPRISRFNIPNKYDHHHGMNIKEEIYLATPPKSKLHPCTPTSARSESSWNSQNALLQHKSQSQSHSQPQLQPQPQPEGKRKTKKSNRKRFLSGFGCNICMCSDSGSIAVEDHEHQHVGEIRADVVENLEKQRKSLQVFGSPLQDMKKGRSFRMLTSSGFVNIDQEEEEEDSDGSSSDLFEIESITGKGNPAPSEASIEWSVVTASAADFSVISDYDDITGANHKTAAGAGDTRRRGGISLGCKSGKAVSVADRIISNDQAVRRVPDMPPLPMRFLSVNNKIMEFDSTPIQRVLSLPRSQHNSHLFYIH